MEPLYLARIEDLGRGDLVQVDCAACHHVALLRLDYLLRLGLIPQAKVLDLRGGSDVEDAERGDGLSFRSSGGAKADKRASASRARQGEKPKNATA